MLREDLKGCTSYKLKPLKFQTKKQENGTMSPRGDYLQWIRKITEEFDEALYYCWCMTLGR